VPESVMPKYGYMADTLIDGRYIQDIMKTHRLVGVPYTDEMIENAQADFRAQSDPDADTAGLEARYAKVNIRNFDSAPGISEFDALIAYLQMLGTLVDFSTYTPVASR
jgi:cytochrome c oxidase cbb3-type subunit 2